MTQRVFGAVDIGASGGRVMAGVVDGVSVSLEPIHRFPNSAREIDGHLRWDMSGLYGEALAGLDRLAARYPEVESVGIDTWGVDYGLLDSTGRLLAEPIAYRDDRTAAAIDDVHAVISREELFAINGLQFLPFNTIYQLAAEKRGPLWSRTAHVVLLPDLIAYWLTGVLRSEYTNASTTGLLDLRTRDWSAALLGRLGIPAEKLPAIVQPGALVGFSSGSGLPVTTVASHDTASAVVGVPATTGRFAYIASGTWSLVGLELARPVLTEDARAANFTNEGGADGRTRFLRNVGGLWLLQESMLTWGTKALADLLAAAESLPGGGPMVDVDDPVFLPPGRMPERIAAAVADTGQRPPETAAETVRCIVDSLAAAYARTVHQAAELSGETVEVIHIVGGGSQNALLCQLTADFSGLRVIAGPVEATALGNVLIQARTYGAMPDSLEDIRACAAGSTPLRRFEPS